MTNLGKILQKS